jgi:hypothetical protein
MKPHSLAKPRVMDPKHMMSPSEAFAALGPHAKRFGRVKRDAQGNKIPFPETQVAACPRVKMSDLPKGWIPSRLYERNLEQNQQIAGCCRHPENHDIEARKSHSDEPAPDIYIFHCNECQRKHRVFCVGTGDERPMWDAS